MSAMIVVCMAATLWTILVGLLLWHWLPRWWDLWANTTAVTQQLEQLHQLQINTASCLAMSDVILQADQRLTNLRATLDNWATYEVPPGINLPNPHKAAFSSEELYRQQSDMQTHDAGLQALLDAVLLGYRQLHGVSATADQLKFSVNFATPATSQARRFVFKFTEPAADQLDVKRTFNRELGTPGWEISSSALHGKKLVVASESTLRVADKRPEPEIEEGRSRVILLD
jgi:hypothetical protein